MVRAILKEEGFAGLFAGKCHAVYVVGLLLLGRIELNNSYGGTRYVCRCAKGWIST